MYITFQNISTTSIDFNSLVGKYICFLSKDSETLKMTTGKYVTNCNYIYFVKKITPYYLMVTSTFSNGEVIETKLRKDSFEDGFFKGHYVICDSKPVWNTEVGTYPIPVPDYKFTSSPDLSKSFTTEEVNELLTNEFLGQNKSYSDVEECIETLCNIIMKRHFDYINISKSYFNETNFLHVGLTIKDGDKYLDSFGQVIVKSYGGKINYIKFEPFNWLSRRTGFEGYNFTTFEDVIIKYLSDNKDYIDRL